jgi:hypothetical protein
MESVLQVFPTNPFLCDVPKTHEPKLSLYLLAHGALNPRRLVGDIFLATKEASYFFVLKRT